MNSEHPDSNNDNEKLKNGVLSLTHISRLKCINNAHFINDIGTTPYHLIAPILMKKTAKSLKQIEYDSPQIMHDSEPLWKALIKRDFPDRPLNQTTLKNGKKSNISSRTLYDKYLNDRERQRENAANNLKKIVRNLNDLKNKNKVKAINKVLPTNKRKLTNNQINGNKNSRIFKSSLLQKARIVNKQRVRNFQQTNVIGTNRNGLGLINLGSLKRDNKGTINTGGNKSTITNSSINMGTRTGNTNNINKKKIELSNSVNISRVKRQKIKPTSISSNKEKSK